MLMEALVDTADLLGRKNDARVHIQVTLGQKVTIELKLWIL